MYNYYIDKIKNKEKENEEIKKINRKKEKIKRKSNFIKLFLIL